MLPKYVALEKKRLPGYDVKWHKFFYAGTTWRQA